MGASFRGKLNASSAEAKALKYMQKAASKSGKNIAKVRKDFEKYRDKAATEDEEREGRYVDAGTQHARSSRQRAKAATREAQRRRVYTGVGRGSILRRLIRSATQVTM